MSHYFHIFFSFVLQLFFKWDLLISQVLKVEQTWKLLGGINGGVGSLGIEQVKMFFNWDYSDSVCKNKIDLDVQPPTYTHQKWN
jgi:hypothetical protein